MLLSKASMVVGMKNTLFSMEKSGGSEQRNQTKYERFHICIHRSEGTKNSTAITTTFKLY